MLKNGIAPAPTALALLFVVARVAGPLGLFVPTSQGILGTSTNGRQQCAGAAMWLRGFHFAAAAWSGGQLGSYEIFGVPGAAAVSVKTIAANRKNAKNGKAFRVGVLPGAAAVSVKTVAANRKNAKNGKSLGAAAVSVKTIAANRKNAKNGKSPRVGDHGASSHRQHHRAASSGERHYRSVGPPSASPPPPPANYIGGAAPARPQENALLQQEQEDEVEGDSELVGLGAPVIARGSRAPRRSPTSISTLASSSTDTEDASQDNSETLDNHAGPLEDGEMVALARVSQSAAAAASSSQYVCVFDTGAQNDTWCEQQPPDGDILWTNGTNFAYLDVNGTALPQSCKCIQRVGYDLAAYLWTKYEYLKPEQDDAWCNEQQIQGSPNFLYQPATESTLPSLLSGIDDEHGAACLLRLPKALPTASYVCVSYAAGQDDAWCEQESQVNGTNFLYTQGENQPFFRLPKGQRYTNCRCLQQLPYNIDAFTWKPHDYTQGEDSEWCKTQQQNGNGYIFTDGKGHEAFPSKRNAVSPANPVLCLRREEHMFWLGSGTGRCLAKDGIAEDDAKEVRTDDSTATKRDYAVFGLDKQLQQCLKDATCCYVSWFATDGLENANFYRRSAEGPDFQDCEIQPFSGGGLTVALGMSGAEEPARLAETFEKSTCRVPMGSISPTSVPLPITAPRGVSWRYYATHCYMETSFYRISDPIQERASKLIFNTAADADGVAPLGTFFEKCATLCETSYAMELTHLKQRDFQCQCWRGEEAFLNRDRELVLDTATKTNQGTGLDSKVHGCDPDQSQDADMPWTYLLINTELTGSCHTNHDTRYTGGRPSNGTTADGAARGIRTLVGCQQWCAENADCEGFNFIKSDPNRDNCFPLADLQAGTTTLEHRSEGLSDTMEVLGKCREEANGGREASRRIDQKIMVDTDEVGLMEKEPRRRRDGAPPEGAAIRSNKVMMKDEEDTTARRSEEHSDDEAPPPGSFSSLLATGRIFEVYSARLSGESALVPHDEAAPRTTATKEHTIADAAMTPLPSSAQSQSEEIEEDVVDDKNTEVVEQESDAAEQPDSKLLYRGAGKGAVVRKKVAEDQRIKVGRGVVEMLPPFGVLVSSEQDPPNSREALTDQDVVGTLFQTRNDTDRCPFVQLDLGAALADVAAVRLGIPLALAYLRRLYFVTNADFTMESKADGSPEVTMPARNAGLQVFVTNTSRATTPLCATKQLKAHVAGLNITEGTCEPVDGQPLVGCPVVPAKDLCSTVAYDHAHFDSGMEPIGVAPETNGALRHDTRIGRMQIDCSKTEPGRYVVLHLPGSASGTELRSLGLTELTAYGTFIITTTTSTTTTTTTTTTTITTTTHAGAGGFIARKRHDHSE
ncbi:unnamed protein product [Amoebophrya sp. A120]|nr:unnamed protein product [Amoebophrya sp. A120]|eukprot:GSA120T00010351001.1